MCFESGFISTQYQVVGATCASQRTVYVLTSVPYRLCKLEQIALGTIQSSNAIAISKFWPIHLIITNTGMNKPVSTKNDQKYTSKKCIPVTYVHVYYIIYDMNEEETTQWHTYQEDNEYKRGHYSNTSLHTSHVWLIILCDRILLLSFYCRLKLRPHTLLSNYINDKNNC